MGKVIDVSNVLDEAIEWHKETGGNSGTHDKAIAGHALKALEEMIELCFACGARIDEVCKVTARQCDAQVANPNTSEDISEEAFDTLACLAVLTHQFNIRIQAAGYAKLKVLREREWGVTTDGVLLRPERLESWEVMRHG